MTRSLKFERSSNLGRVPDEVIIPLNAGQTVEDAGHRAIAYFSEMRYPGPSLPDISQKKAFRAMVRATIAYNDAGEEFDAFVRTETKEDKKYIFSEDKSERVDLPVRRELDLAVKRVELVLLIATENFLSLAEDRPRIDEFHEHIEALVLLDTKFDPKRDVLVS